MNIKGKLGLMDQVGEGLERIGEWGGGYAHERVYPCIKSRFTIKN